MNVLIADNESISCLHLTNMLNLVPNIRVIGDARNGIEAITKTTALHPDILLLNVNIPRLDGISVARKIAKTSLPPAVIFVSSSGSQSLAALDAHAVGYLLKPVQKKRLEQAVNYVRSTRLMSEQIAATTCKDHIFYCRSGKSVYMVDLMQVHYLKAHKKYTELRSEKNSFLSSRPLIYFEKKYDHFLLRARRNVLINKFYVKEIGRPNNSNYVVTLKKSEEKIKVSRRNGTSVRKNLE